MQDLLSVYCIVVLSCICSFLVCVCYRVFLFCFFFQAEDGIRDGRVNGVQTCALPICTPSYLELWFWGAFNPSDPLGFAVALRDPDGNVVSLQDPTGTSQTSLKVGADQQTGRSEERRVGKERKRRGAAEEIKRRIEEMI